MKSDPGAFLFMVSELPTAVLTSLPSAGLPASVRGEGVLVGYCAFPLTISKYSSTAASHSATALFGSFP